MTKLSDKHIDPRTRFHTPFGTHFNLLLNVLGLQNQRNLGFWGPLGASGGVSGSLGGPLGVPGNLSASPWGPLGGSLGGLGVLWGSLGAPWGASWGPFGPPKALLGARGGVLSINNHEHVLLSFLLFW